MQSIERKISSEKTAIYRASERSTNLFSLVFTTVLLCLSILSEILNEIGMFTLPKETMRISVLLVCVIFLVPIGLYVVRDRILKREKSTLEYPWFRTLILISLLVGIGEICIIYTHHTIILLAVPPLIVAQYRRRTRFALLGFLGALILVPVSVYGGFFLGVADRNLMKTVADGSELASLASRVAVATPTRMTELFLHYVIPRFLCVAAVIVLAVGVMYRNRRMIDRQDEMANEIQDSLRRQSAMQSQVIDALATLIETRDEGTGDHVLRTKKYVSMIANAMKADGNWKDQLTAEEIDRIENASPLHDVGKIAVSDTILLKPGRLTPEEFDKMKIHTVKGMHMITSLFEQMDDPLFLKTAEDIAIAHHEKWDGSGYPYGRKGEEIPLSARIMAVADVYDALVSYRVYKPSISPEEALEIIYSEAGTHFDPEIIRVVRQISQDLILTARTPLVA